MATLDTEVLPRWDLGGLYPAVDAPEVVTAEADLVRSLAALADLYDRHGVGPSLSPAPAADGERAGVSPPSTGGAAADDATAGDNTRVGNDTRAGGNARAGDGVRAGGNAAAGDAGAGGEGMVPVATFDEVLEATNTALESFARLEAYAYAQVSTAGDDEVAQGLVSRLAAVEATVTTLRGRFDAWVGRLDLEALVAAAPAAAAHAWPLRKAARRAGHQMSGPEEALAAELGVTGSTAWARLYEDVTAAATSTVTFPDGQARTMGVFACRGLATDPDPALRRAAFAAESGTWKAVAVPLAAALNALKGETLALGARRRWDDPLAAVLEASAVSRSAFEAMQQAVDDALPDFRRYLVAKAGHLGKRRLAFWDLFAPVGDAPRRGWDDATAMVEQAFSGYSDDLADLARHALAASWVDAGPRPGKVGGGFCLPVGRGDSRILMNYDGSIDSVHTLAHEMGHAYHNRALASRTPLQRSTPMTLAETASIFCETILTDHTLDAATSDGERLALLEADLQGACQVVVDIRSRFLFESRLFERRRASAAGVRELCELMGTAQAEAYGDALDPDELHPYMWAAKPHYYGSTFYNWPYTFGLLFGLGLYARWQAEPDGFRAAYDEMLSSTGLATASELAARFGIDVEDVAFWASSLDVLRSRIDDFCTAAGNRRAIAGRRGP